jgi:hypothetical protein
MPEDDQSQFDPASALCRKFDQGLTACLEGEDRPEVLAHAQQCPFCSVVLADLEQIRFVSHHLLLKEPPARVWANIRATLEAEGIIREQVPVWHRWLPGLAFRPSLAPVGALACLALLGLTLLVSPRNLQIPANVEGSPAGVKITMAAAFVPVVSDELTRTLTEMESTYRARESFLEPAMKDTYRKSLKSLDASIEESMQHCQRDPGSTLAREYLINAYQSKVEVLGSALESIAR